MPCVKQGGIKYHFLSIRYDSTWDWTAVSRAISEYSNLKANESSASTNTEQIKYFNTK